MASRTDSPVSALACGFLCRAVDASGEGGGGGE